MPPKNVKRNFSNRDRSGDAKRSRSGYHAKEHDKCEWCGFSFARVDRHRLHCTQRPAGFAQAARSGAPTPVPGTSASAGTLPLSHANVLGLPVVLEEEDGVEFVPYFFHFLVNYLLFFSEKGMKFGCLPFLQILKNLEILAKLVLSQG